MHDGALPPVSVCFVLATLHGVPSPPLLQVHKPSADSKLGVELTSRPEWRHPTVASVLEGGGVASGRLEAGDVIVSVTAATELSRAELRHSEEAANVVASLLRCAWGDVTIHVHRMQDEAQRSRRASGVSRRSSTRSALPVPTVTHTTSTTTERTASSPSLSSSYEPQYEPSSLVSQGEQAAEAGNSAHGVAQVWLQREVSREDALDHAGDHAGAPLESPQPEGPADYFALSDDDDFAPLELEVNIVEGRYVLVSLRNAAPTTPNTGSLLSLTRI